tara:strand:- start:5065 stop:5307 length:243 start_codon:yes stop_codon:yes gene_type:complete
MAKKKAKKKISKKSAVKKIEVKDSKEVTVVGVTEVKEVTDKKQTKNKKEGPVITVPLVKDSIQRVYVKPKFNYLKAQGVK